MRLPAEAGSRISPNGQGLLLGRATLVPMAVRIQIPRLMAGMIVMFAGDFFWAGLVAVAVLVQIARLVSGMIVMRSGLFLWHCFLQMLRGRHAA